MARPAAPTNPFVAAMRASGTGYRPVPARLRSSAEIYETPQRHPGNFGWLQELSDAWAKQWRVATSPVEFLDVFGAAPSREGGASSIDPTTRAGLENWTSIFTPGPGRGGKFVGERGALENAFLRQLNNVEGGRPPFSHALDEDYASPGEPLPPEVLDAMREPYFMRGEMEEGRGFSRPVQAGQGGGSQATNETLRAVRKIQALLGYAPRGDPGEMLAQLVSGKERPGYGDFESKLGIMQDTRPDWLVPRSTINEVQKRQPGEYFDAESRRGFGQELREDNRDALAMIIETIRRRQGR